MTDNSLMHYGVKGMKWGVRHDSSNENSRHNKQNDSTNKKSLSTNKKIAIAIGVTATVAVGAYFAKKYFDMNADTMIKKGKEFQHMGRLDEDLSKPFFASHLKQDNRKYAKNNFFGAHWATQKTLISENDIKIAGRKVSRDTFAEWVKESPIAKQKFPNLDVSDKSAIKSKYYSFNRNLNSPDIRDKEIFDDYFSRLRDKGYDAIRDMNDQTQSNMRSPIIVFNKLSGIKEKKVKYL